MASKGLEKKLTSEEKQNITNIYKEEGRKEESAMEKKYLEIQDMAIHHENLAKTLKIKQKDINAYAKKSPKFAETLRNFHDKASTSYENFKKWIKSYMEDSKGITTLKDALINAATLKSKLIELRKQTLQNFVKIKTGMKESIKKMAYNERVRLVYIDYYKEVPYDVAKKFPRRQRAEIIKRIKTHPGFVDTLTLMRTVSYEEFDKKYKSPKFIVEQRNFYKKIATEPLKPEIKRFSAIRAERSKLKQELLSLHPNANLNIPKDMPGKTWGDIDLEYKNEENPWRLSDPITNSLEFLSSQDKDGNEFGKEHLEYINSINKNLGYQVDALKILIKSEKAKAALAEFDEFSMKFIKTWEANGANPNKTYDIMVSYSGNPKEIFNLSYNDHTIFSPNDSEKLINTSKNSMLVLAEGIKKVEKYKNLLASSGQNINSAKWSLTEVDSPAKMQKRFKELKGETLLASRKERRRRSHKA